MRKIFITEEQLHLILERQHISDEVVNKTQELKRIIQNFVGFMEKRNPELDVIRGRDEIEIFGREFTVIFIVHKTDENIEQTPQVVDFDKNIIKLQVQKYSNGTYDYESFDDAIGHELMHAYQRFKKNKPLISNNDQYEHAVDIIVGNQRADDFTKDISKLIYFSKKPEQDAIVQGAYEQCCQRLNDNPNLSVDDVFNEVAVIKEISYLFSNLMIGFNNNNRFLINACTNFNKTPRYFYTLLLKTNKRINRKLLSIRDRLISEFKR